MADGLLEWPSGVGGVQCEDCGRSTICRAFFGHFPDESIGEWLCRPCVEGWPDDEEYDEESASSDASLGAASTTRNPPPGEQGEK